ncbi:beta-lactam-binding protein with PASTA domain [Enterococcus sp. PF1-24]|uniref:PASTA domain-containing protein n=1 Tax=unclassified Enterococcus TaxID=2608891 RepID=UPI0024745181|nr:MULTISPECIES: PASTA domain-containing protein [unclassified Enterococcus]MDH6363144.1 beta-lactam-binding protein with PASTA domain [Enterococcus sp. PFB1-1]MDH6400238.1 beta-lactam-binding protein with PASTA domain [Enterococcus sp. PF1-24]
MSDFLSGFDKDKYQQRQATAKANAETKEAKEATDFQHRFNRPLKDSEAVQADKIPPADITTAIRQQITNSEKSSANQITESLAASEEQSKQESFSAVVLNEAVEPLTRASRNQQVQEEESEFDPTFKKRQQKKRQIIVGGILLSLLIVVFGYYQMTYVKLTDFQGKELSEARTWLSKHKLKLDLVQEFSEEVAANQVISQKQKADKKVKKGSSIQLTASKGADPEEVIVMPDFLAMTKAEAEAWKKEQLADNFSIIEEYHENVEKGQPLRLEFNNKETTRETYQRKEKAKLYISKGLETFEKNIEMPDFVNKTKTEVEAWVKKNEIKASYQELPSNEIMENNIIAQNVPVDEKVAKQDEILFAVSIGKAKIVPDFAEYTPEEAATAGAGLNLQVKSIYSETVSYGQLISQNVAVGTELTVKDTDTIKVVYSAGRPYIKDLRETFVEGDLQKYFYDEYQAKGANIRYTVRYVDSAAAKGSIVSMSPVNQYLGLEATITIDISLGNLSY